jgi:FkbM family methyltransferase
MGLSSIAKFCLKTIFSKLGYDIKRRSVWSEDLNLVHLAICAMLNAEDDFFFIQIGAHDGITDDPIHDAILKHGLSGLLVEPLQDKFLQLQRNYLGSPGLLFENSAIAAHDGVASLFRIWQDRSQVWQDRSLEQNIEGIVSFELGKFIRSGIQREHIEEIQVKTLTIQTLLKKYNLSVDDITMLQIDTDGFDFEILKMAFECGCLPRLIHFEHIWLSSKDTYQCYELLKKKAYKHVRIGINTLAVHESI